MSDHGLAVDHERLRLEAERSMNDGREAVGPVMAVAGEAMNASIIPADHQPVAVVFDFMNPKLAGRRNRHLGGPTRFDEG